MLILTRRAGERINIGDDIVIHIHDIQKNKVRIGIEAPESVTVLRHEIYEAIQKENLLSAEGAVNDVLLAAKLLSRNREE